MKNVTERINRKKETRKKRNRKKKKKKKRIRVIHIHFSRSHTALIIVSVSNDGLFLLFFYARKPRRKTEINNLERNYIIAQFRKKTA